MSIKECIEKIHLHKYFTYTGLPGKIQSDQGTNFVSKLIQEVPSMLDIRQIHSAADPFCYIAPCEPGSNKTFPPEHVKYAPLNCLANGTDWDQSIRFVFFAAWDAKQETLGFTQFELVYGHLARGPLKLINYSLLDKANSENLFTYVGRVKR